MQITGCAPQRPGMPGQRPPQPPFVKVGKGLVPGLALCAALIVGGRAGAGDDDAKAEEARRARQLDKMKRSAAQYTLCVDGDRRHSFKFVESTVLRWTNPVAGAKDGTVFLWTRGGRPQAALQLYTYDDDHFNHEWQSLADGRLTAERAGEVTWNPIEPGIRFEVLPDFEAPAASAPARLRQMKSIAAKFSFVFTGFGQSPTAVELRLLPQPLYRYEQSNDPQRFDGALFAFVQGTDPQGLLVVEARGEGAKQRWHYGIARMASGSVTARLGDREVFSVGKYDFSRDPRKTFLTLHQQPVPEKDDVEP